MKHNSNQSGFSAVELLITLFIASLFLLSGYQLYLVVIKDGGEARQQARTLNVADDYLQQYKNKANPNCTNAVTGLNNQSIIVTGLSNVTVSVTVSCFNSSVTTLMSKVSVTLNYGNPQKTINESTYVTP